MKTYKSAAAELLDVSESYLDKLLSQGAVTLEVEDLIKYRRKRDTERLQLSAERTQFLQEKGFYDE
jgi:uncharacterized protein YehS (DUF1456 family)